jgi:hypothetical protein
MKTFIITTIIFISSLLTSCTDPMPSEPELPPATMTGANTFGCKINGKVWVPSVQSPGNKRLTISLENDNLQIQAWIERNNTFFETVSIDILDLDNKGNYQIPPPPFNGKMYKADRLGSDCWHRVTPENSSIIITKFDLSAKIVSGTFEYLKMKSPCDSTDIVNITEGRFDMKF